MCLLREAYSCSYEGFPPKTQSNPDLTKPLPKISIHTEPGTTRVGEMTAQGFNQQNVLPKPVGQKPSPFLNTEISQRETRKVRNLYRKSNLSDTR